MIICGDSSWSNLATACAETARAFNEATQAIHQYTATVVRQSKWFPKKDRRKIGRMIRRGRIIRIGKEGRP